MAWVVEKPTGFMTRWRDGKTGRVRSRLWSFSNQRSIAKFAGDEISDEDVRQRARAAAESFAAEMERTERRSTGALKRLLARNPKLDVRIFGDLDQAGETLESFVRQVIERSNIRESSKATYRHTARNHIEGTPLGRTPLALISPEDVEAYWQALDVGDGARRNIAQVLRKAFSRAVQRDLIDANPLTRAEIAVPSKKHRVRGQIRVLEPEELGRLVDAAGSQRDRCIILLMGYGGLRGGEVGGLTRRDVVRKSGYCELRLHQQVIRIGREKKITELKTEAARRSVPVPCSVVDEIDVLLAEHSPSADGRIFHGPNGELVAVQGINNAVQRTARRSGLGPVNSHLLRHTAASLWIDDGADPESVRRALGHSDIKITLGLYGHMFSYGAARLAESMERRIQTYRDRDRTAERNPPAGFSSSGIGGAKEEG